MQRRALLAGLVVGVLFAASASAQDDAAAEALFNKGLADMEAGRYETACPTLSESQRLGPRMGTLFTLAECEAKGGMIASALAHYEEYLRQFARLTPQQKGVQAGREKISAAQKTALAPLVPYVTLTLPADAPSGASVKWDDLVLNLPALGVPLPVNPGEHVVTTQVPGGSAAQQRLSVEKGEKKQIELKFAPPTANEATPVTPVAQPAAANISGEGAETSSAPASRKTWMYAAGGIGATGIVVGAVTGALVLGKKSTILDNCIDTSCNPAGKQAADSAQSLGLVSTLGFGVGIAGLATAAFLFLTEPAKTSASAPAWTPVIADRKDGIVVGVARIW